MVMLLAPEDGSVVPQCGQGSSTGHLGPLCAQPSICCCRPARFCWKEAELALEIVPPWGVTWNFQAYS